MGASVDDCAPRPVGMLQPSHERAALALKAINEARWRDARKHLDAIADSGGALAAWRQYLEGELHFRQGCVVEADGYYVRAAAISLAPRATSLTAANVEDPGSAAARLAAAALEQLGTARRRQERFAHAIRAHQLALALRREHGSAIEEWQSAMSLGVDLSLAGDHDRALRTLSRARAIARTLPGGPDEQSGPATGAFDEAYAIALEHSARAMAAAGRQGDCVGVCREVLELRGRLNPSGAASPLARMNLGRALLQQAEALMDGDSGEAARSLQEAIRHLEEAAESLGAFGSKLAADTRQCQRLLDFANRLSAQFE